MGRKQKKIKPDDYFEHSTFQVARFGKLVCLQHIIITEQHEELVKKNELDYDNQVSISQR